MAKKEKTYKCAYCHCGHDNIVSENEAIKINGRYWHIDCKEISETIQDIITLYRNHISDMVVASLLQKTINIIVFKKLRDTNVSISESDLKAAKYLLFALQYAVDKHIALRSPLGLHYLIDNRQIKDAWGKKLEKEIQREAAANAVTGESKHTVFKLNEEKSAFDFLFNGQNNE